MSEHDKKIQSAPPDVFAVVSTVSEQLQAIEKFVSRRFDEISMEINATAQQVDMAEEGIIGRFSEVLEVIAAIAHKGDGSTPANAGVELDAVVDMTESAAIAIMDAAGRITGLTNNQANWNTPESAAQARENINKEVDEIFMSCSFQDITGQRIRKTLENLQIIEDRLGAALEKLGIHISIDDKKNSAIPTNIATNQDDIDALFSAGKNR